MISLVSVLLPVYNGERYIAQSIESILVQTRCDLELIIIDDGSIDGSWNIIRRYTDSRVRAIRQQNRGLAGTLNKAIKLAKGKFIARQDQDDIALPERIALQIEYMEQYSSVGLLGTWADIIEEDVSSKRTLKHPTGQASIVFSMLFDNAFVHSSVMIRRSILQTTGGYDETLTKDPPEDYELWSRMMRHTDVANLGEVLLHYRETAGSMSRKPDPVFMKRVMAISAGNIAWMLGIEVTDTVRDFVLLYHSKPVVRLLPPWTYYQRTLESLAAACCKRYAVEQSDIAPVYQRVEHHLHDRYHQPHGNKLLRLLKRYGFS